MPKVSNFPSSRAAGILWPRINYLFPGENSTSLTGCDFKALMPSNSWRNTPSSQWAEGVIVTANPSLLEPEITVHVKSYGAIGGENAASPGPWSGGCAENSLSTCLDQRTEVLANNVFVLRRISFFLVTGHQPFVFLVRHTMRVIELVG